MSTQVRPAEAGPAGAGSPEAHSPEAHSPEAHSPETNSPETNSPETNSPESTAAPVRVTLRPSIWRRASLEQRAELEVVLQALSDSGSFGLRSLPWGSRDPVWRDEPLPALACAVALAEVRLGLTDTQLIVALFNHEAALLTTAYVGLEPLRPLMRSYITLIHKLGGRISMHAPSQFEALDLGRRAFHNEAGALLLDALQGRLTLDLETARRLFTVMCVVYA